MDYFGLPTALDDSITYVQRFVAKNGDLDKSADIFLAINNAILAGGANAQTQATAIEQFTQSFTKGKPDLMEWRTLLTAMPGQLKQIAQAMGYASADDLYNAFKDNKISMDDFTDAVIRLDKDGTNGMASFQEQAKKATGGIGTAVKNLKTRVVRALANVIDKVNESLKAYGGISGVIEKLSKSITKVITKVGDFLAKVIKQLPKILAELKKWLPVIEGVFAGFMAYKAITGIINGVQVAMALLNAVMAMNPVMALVIGITALTTGLLALKKATSSQTQEEKEHSEALKESAEKAQEAVKAYDDLRQAQQEQINAGMTEIANYEALWDELQGIVDQNGKVKEGYEDRASFITSTLSNALGIEIQDIDGVIQKYSELQESIDKTIEKKKAQIILDAQETLYKEAIEKQTKALKELRDSEDELKTKKQERADLEDKLIEKQKELDELRKNYYYGIASDRKILEDEIQTIEVKMDRLDEETSSLQINYDKQTDIIEKYAYDVGQYEKNMELFHDEKYDEMTNTNWDYVQEYQKAGDAQKAQLEDQIKTTEKHLTMLQNLKKKEGTDLYDQQIKNDEKLLSQYKADLKKYESATSEGLENTKEATKEGILDINTIVKPSAESVGKNINQGLINGLNSNRGSVNSTIGSIASGLLSKMKSILGIHSPSTVLRDVIGKNMALGIGVGFDKGMNTVENDMSKTLRNIVPQLDMSNLFDLSPTLNNTATSSSNVNVVVYNNMETDFMGNIVNNIKTFSNGAKNDYNYGMS